MRITRATPEDLDTLVAFRDQAAAWLASRGIDQWQEPGPTEDLMVEGILGRRAARTSSQLAQRRTRADRQSPVHIAERSAVVRCTASCRPADGSDKPCR